jgi:hypothetical protein
MARAARKSRVKQATPWLPTGEAEAKNAYLEFLTRLMRHMQAAIRGNAAVSKGATYYGGYEMSEEVRNTVTKVANSHRFDCQIDDGGMDAYSIRLRWLGGKSE